MRDTSATVMHSGDTAPDPTSTDLLTFDSETKAGIFAARHQIAAWPHHLGCGRYALVYWDSSVRGMVGLIDENRAKTLPDW